MHVQYTKSVHIVPVLEQCPEDINVSGFPVLMKHHASFGIIISYVATVNNKSSAVQNFRGSLVF